MTARIAEAQTRAEHAESLEEYWRRAWEDGTVDDAERVEIDRRLHANVKHWSAQVLEISVIAAWLTGGIPAALKKHSRISKLRRELKRNGETWAADPDECDETAVAVVIVSEAA